MIPKIQIPSLFALFLGLCLLSSCSGNMTVVHPQGAATSSGSQAYPGNGAVVPESPPTYIKNKREAIQNKLNDSLNRFSYDQEGETKERWKREDDSTSPTTKPDSPTTKPDSSTSGASN